MSPRPSPTVGHSVMTHCPTVPSPHDPSLIAIRCTTPWRWSHNRPRRPTHHTDAPRIFSASHSCGHHHAMPRRATAIAIPTQDFDTPKPQSVAHGDALTARSAKAMNKPSLRPRPMAHTMPNGVILHRCGNPRSQGTAAHTVLRLRWCGQVHMTVCAAACSSLERCGFYSPLMGACTSL